MQYRTLLDWGLICLHIIVSFWINETKLTAMKGNNKSTKVQPKLLHNDIKLYLIYTCLNTQVS